MEQLSLFRKQTQAYVLSKPVNVASVPQRSPFRYPGGKTWFVPTFRKWIKNKDTKPRILIEPFAGGGIITLTALFENLVERALMVELDEDIAAVWIAVINGHADWIAQRILTFELTKENALRELEKTYNEPKEIAFQTILKNRTFHGGILADGAGFLKKGEAGKGIRSRWYPQTLAKRLRNLDLIQERLEFRRDDGMKTIAEYRNDKAAIFFIDPPYTAGGKNAGKRLYKYSHIDHERLFDICTDIQGDFIMTYDNSVEVRLLAQKYGLHTKEIAMKNTHHSNMTELVIGKELQWME